LFTFYDVYKPIKIPMMRPAREEFTTERTLLVKSLVYFSYSIIGSITIISGYHGSNGDFIQRM